MVFLRGVYPSLVRDLHMRVQVSWCDTFEDGGTVRHGVLVRVIVRVCLRTKPFDSFPTLQEAPECDADLSCLMDTTPLPTFVTGSIFALAGGPMGRDHPHATALLRIRRVVLGITL